MFSWILLQSYWWIGLTTVLYLYVFLSFLINYYTQNILINFFFLIYLFFMRDLFFNQFSLREINFFFFWSNDFLTNSLNQIHPPFFFLTIGCLLFYLIYNERWFSENNLFFFLKQVIIYPYLILVLILIPLLFLGGWWAWQEGNWGGWWNWDPSELIALYFFFYILWKIHYISNISFLNLINTTRRSFIFLIFIFLFTQVNFSLLSHNFGLRYMNFFSPQFTLITALIIIFSMEYFFYFFDFFMQSLISYQRKKQLPIYLSLYFNVFILIYLLLSFLDISFFFFWSFLQWFSLNIFFFFSFFNIFIFFITLYLLGFYSTSLNLIWGILFLSIFNCMFLISGGLLFWLKLNFHGLICISTIFILSSLWWEESFLIWELIFIPFHFSWFNLEYQYFILFNENWIFKKTYSLINLDINFFLEDQLGVFITTLLSILSLYLIKYWKLNLVVQISLYTFTLQTTTSFFFS